MHRSIVFLGPSLDTATAASILAAEYRSPAKRGDIARAAADGAEIIVLIDGVYHQENAVAHREILAAVRAGIKVIGASSMGALRAAEMHTLGMNGIGTIFELFASGKLVSDDEVALVFDPESGIALSEPLINIRCTLKRAVSAEVIDAAAHDALLAAAQSIFYPDRTYGRIIAGARDRVDAEVLDRFRLYATTHPCDLKREDAIRALEYAAKVASKVAGKKECA
jgi:hypothetical protein